MDAVHENILLFKVINFILNVSQLFESSSKSIENGLKGIKSFAIEVHYKDLWEEFNRIVW